MRKPDEIARRLEYVAAVLAELDAEAIWDATTQAGADVQPVGFRGPTGTYDYYVQVKQSEFREYQSRVTDWEVDRYLTLF